MRRMESLTSKQEAQLVELWDNEEYSSAELAVKIGCKQWQLSCAARRLGLPRHHARNRPCVDDPTEDEIEERCKEIREKFWTEDDYYLRSVGKLHALVKTIVAPKMGGNKWLPY